MKTGCPCCGNDTYEQEWGNLVCCQACGRIYERKFPVVCPQQTVHEPIVPNSWGIIPVTTCAGVLT
jgi:hypothetical protein